jgi:hypothetical protein
MYSVEITLSDSQNSTAQERRHALLADADAAGLQPIASSVSSDPPPRVHLDYASRTDAYAAAWTFTSSLNSQDQIEVHRRDISTVWRVRIAFSDIDAPPTSSPLQEWRAFVRWLASQGASCNLRPLRVNIRHKAYGCLDYRHEHQAQRVATAAPHNLYVDRGDVDVVKCDVSDLPSHGSRV